MCYFKSNSQKVEEIETRYKAKAKDPKQHKARYKENGFDFLKLAIVRAEDPAILSFHRWGLVPSWTKSVQDAKEMRAKTLNARAETIFEKPSFKNIIVRKRCLVPSTGYFEWMHNDKRKIPHFLSLREHRPFSFAGIYDSWINPTSGERYDTFSIVTTEANPLAARIHNSKQRMPLILTEKEEEMWLDKNLSEVLLKSLFRPFPEEEMQAWEINDKRMKETQDTDPKIIEPFTDPAGMQASLF
jgi:putative SOS response-associated peptidase YedK